VVRDRSVFTEAEQETIRAAAAQILAHPSFQSSERSTKLFRYLLDRALANEDETLKERRIGHEVFGREISYDTGDDPVVRNAASDIRKRLRQYDAESSPDLAVHISLDPGTYVLDFRFDEAVSQEEELSGRTQTSPAVQPPMPFISHAPVSAVPLPKPSRLPWWIAAVATIACLFFASAFFWQRQQMRAAGIGVMADNPLWSPMSSSGKEIFISLGHAQSPVDDHAQNNTSAGLQRITITDLKAYTNISGFLRLNGQGFQMRTDNQTTLLDLRDRPTVLIGIFNNQWALRLTSNLRFHFDFSEADPTNPNRAVTVVDSDHPDQRAWRVKLGAPGASTVDYAIAGRLLDPITGGLVLSVAGAGSVGTQAASEFDTQLRFLRSLPASLKNPRTNIQVVLRTPIVDGIPGTPEVIATNEY
jgi:hypothetical protein